ncbi:MAG: DUF2203 domain-containing protein [Terriglobales bacterium]
MAKLFTLDEAEELLPVLRALLESAMEAQRKGEQLDGQLQRIVTRVLLLGGVQLDPLKLAALRAERDRAMQKLKDSLGEIEAAGVQVKDLATGLLDFPCMRDGRIVLLCWKLGEECIEHWHGTTEGFAGRKKIDRARFPSGSPPRLN